MKSNMCKSDLRTGMAVKFDIKDDLFRVYLDTSEGKILASEHERVELDEYYNNALECGPNNEWDIVKIYDIEEGNNLCGDQLDAHHMNLIWQRTEEITIPICGHPTKMSAADARKLRDELDSKLN